MVENVFGWLVKIFFRRSAQVTHMVVSFWWGLGVFLGFCRVGLHFLIGLYNAFYWINFLLVSKSYQPIAL